MTTKKDILDIYTHMRTTSSSVPDEALEFMKSVCLEHLDSSYKSYNGLAIPDGSGMIKFAYGVPADKMNDEGIDAYPFVPGKAYKLSIVRISRISSIKKGDN